MILVGIYGNSAAEWQHGGALYHTGRDGRGIYRVEDGEPVRVDGRYLPTTRTALVDGSFTLPACRAEWAAAVRAAMGESQP